MESHSIAEVARASGTDFIFVRAVVDGASRNLPKAFLECADEFGKPSLLKTFSRICEQPAEISSLLRLGIEYRKSLKTLRLASQSFCNIKNGKKRI